METIEKHSGPKIFRKLLNRGSPQIHKLSTEDGCVTTNREEVLEVVENFYSSLYNSLVPEPRLKRRDPRAILVKHIAEDLPEIGYMRLGMHLNS